MTILITLLVYFGALLVLSRLTTRHSSNDTFYRGNRQSPWPLVAFGMVGASISGVTFISVPGMAVTTQFTYLQMCLGFAVGYVVVAFVLLPVYYRLNLTTIYSYLQTRLGQQAYKTGAGFFLLSKILGSAVKFGVICMVLQRFVLDALHIPFALTVVLMMGLIWLYTRRGGIKTLVFTDTFQTFCMFAALLLIIWQVNGALHYSLSDSLRAIAADEHSRIFVWDDFISRQNFWKQFLSGIFVVVVMTGLDQDMMQKNLTCKGLREAQKDMCSYGLAFFPANLLFLALGVLLMQLAAQQGSLLPALTDDLLPLFAASGRLGTAVVVFFTIGIVAASFSSADSALTALTTTWCVDIAERPHDERLRRRTHVLMAVAFAAMILIFNAVNTTSVIDAIYTLCSYTYGPLLGLFAFALFTRYQVRGWWVPWVCIISPVICWAVSLLTQQTTGYEMGYERLMLNGALTFVGLFIFRVR